MLTRIEIDKFKSVQHQTVELGRINVFIGANGSGKSNILEAIGMLSSAAAGRPDIESFQRRGIRIGNPQLYTSRFPDSPTDSFYIAAHASEFAHYGVTFSSEKKHAPFDKMAEHIWAISEYTHGTDTDENDDQATQKYIHSIKSTPPEHTHGSWLRRSIEPDAPFSKIIDHLSRYRIYTPTTPVLRGVEPDRSLPIPVGLAGGRLAESVQELLDFIAFKEAQKGDGDDDTESRLDDLLALIPWAVALRKVPIGDATIAREVPAPRDVLEFVDRYMDPVSNRLTAYDASEGILYVLFALVVALHPGAPSLAAIDNVDQALNPRLARTLMRMICDWSRDLASERQLLLTCHNPLALDGLPLLQDDIRLFAVDRNLAGHTTVQRVEITPEIAKKSKEGWTLSRMWVMGLLGGVPDV